MASTTYVPPTICVGTWHLQDDAGDCGQTASNLAEQYAAQALEISGAPINVFKLLGVHEQGKLLDLTGNGVPLSAGDANAFSAANAFTSPSLGWKSIQSGAAVVQTPAYIGYDFGTKTITTGAVTRQRYAPSAPIYQHITTLRIQQSTMPLSRAVQVRVDRGEGALIPGNLAILHGSTPAQLVTNYHLSGIAFADSIQINETFTISTADGTNFSVVSSLTGLIGTAIVNQRFNSSKVALLINLTAGQPLETNLTFKFTAAISWKRVDIVNLPDTADLETVNIRMSAPARYWRIVPIMFNGMASTNQWEVNRLELMDYEATSIDNVQDWLLEENRDRDYATSSITLRCSYSPTDSIGDLSKFGLSILDQYVFECSFAMMVEKLGRPIVVGDVLEVAPELAYDHHLQPVKKYLEVTDTGWAADGFTPGWRPILYRFQGQQLLPSQEHRDIIGLPNNELYNTDDANFLKALNVNTGAQIASEMIAAEAADKVPETGTDIGEVETAADLQLINPIPQFAPQSPKESMYVEDGLPPPGIEYSESFGNLPSISPPPPDGTYHRVNYPPDTKIPSRLYKFSLLKNKWIYVETDRRMENTSYRLGVQELLTSSTRKSMKEGL